MSAPKRLFRPRSDRIMAGVAGGLGAYLGVDPTVVRALFVLLALTGGFGVVLYVTLAIVVPEEPLPEDHSAKTPVPEHHYPSALRRNAFAIIVIALGVVMLFTKSLIWFRPEVLWPVVVIGIGVYLIARRPQPPPNARG